MNDELVWHMWLSVCYIADHSHANGTRRFVDFQSNLIRTVDFFRAFIEETRNRFECVVVTMITKDVSTV